MRVYMHINADVHRRGKWTSSITDTGGCKPLNVGAEIQTQVLSKSSTHP